MGEHGATVPWRLLVWGSWRRRRCHFVHSILFFFSLYGTTVQCKPSPPSRISLSQLCFFYLSFQFVLHLLTSVCTQFHYLFFDRHLIQLPWRLSLNTWVTFLLLSILLTWLIRFNRLVLKNESISKFAKGCINSLLYHFLQFSFTLIPPNILLKTFLSKAASRLAISLFSIHLN